MKNAQILHRVLAGAVLAVVLATTGCVPTPPSVPAPTLPAGVGVRWLRDTGGTLQGDEGYYSPSPDAYTILDGTVTGPQPFDPLSFPIPPTILEQLGLIRGVDSAPDGTARSPWNGFAGEGITMVATDPTDGDWTLDFPDGSCLMATVGSQYQIQMVSPSPDGTKVAFRSHDFDGGSKIEVKGLVDGATCPAITSAQYQADSPTPSSAGNTLVWSPDSSAVAYEVSRGTSSGIAQLSASPGGSDVDVVAATSGQVVPMGWSVADRLLYGRVRIDGGSPVSRLITRAVAGGPERVLDTATLPTAFPGFSAPLTRGGLSAWLHHGYFVPGTTSIVYDDGSSNVTDDDGYTFPRFYVALIADADQASSKPILGSKPPLAWHQEALTEGAFEPPFDLIDVPNAEFVDRFVH